MRKACESHALFTTNKEQGNKEQGIKNKKKLQIREQPNLHGTSIPNTPSNASDSVLEGCNTPAPSPDGELGWELNGKFYTQEQATQLAIQTQTCK